MQQELNQLELGLLPPLPEVLVRLMRELNGENLNITNLARTMAMDPVLILRVMSVMNSPLYRRRQEMTTIEQAVNLLGVRMVKMIAISVSLQQFIRGFKGLRSDELSRYWRHSLTCALMSQSLARSIGYPDPEEAYITGMLHDIGQLVLLTLKTDRYRAISDAAADESALCESERHAFGLNHAEIAATLLNNWHLPSLMEEAVLHHHEPVGRITSATELVKIIYVANALSSITSVQGNPAIAAAKTLFGMSAEDTLQLCLDTQGKVLELARAMGIPLDDEDVAHDASGQARKSHEKNLQDALAHEISHTSLIAQASEVLDAATNEAELLTSILQTATVLFEPKQAYLFEWDASTNLLSGRPIPEQPDALRRIRLPLELNQSLIADALLWSTIRSNHGESGQNTVSIVDGQVMRIMETTGMVCVPMVSSEFMYGSLVLAYPNESIPRLERQYHLMRTFAAQAALTIARFRREISQLRQTDTSALDDYKLNVRKIIHEVNNPLTIMKNYLKVMELKMGTHSGPSTELRVLNEEIDRIAGIIRKLSSGTESPNTATPGNLVDINATIQDVIHLFESSTLPDAKLKFESRLADNILPIDSDRNRIKQVLINLIKNAVEAVQRNGTIRIASGLTKRDQVQTVTIMVSDTGPGLPKQVLDRLFSQVESTKGDDHAGLGLSIVASLMNELGGAIVHRAIPGSGATFILTLPYRIGMPPPNRQ